MAGKGRVATAVVILIIVGTTWAQAQELPATCKSSPTLSSLLERAGQLLQTGHFTQSKDALRQHRACFREDPGFALMLSRSYEGIGNMAWSMKVLADFAAQAKESCDVKARLSWLLLKRADYRGALALLDDPDCQTGPEQLVRHHLLRAEAMRLAGRVDEAREQARKAESPARMNAEDLALRSHVQSLLWPLRSAPLELRGQLDTGWSSNPLLGSPLDPQSSGGDYASWRSGADVRGSVAGPNWGGARLVLEADFRSRLLHQEEARELSYAGWGLLPGFELTWPGVTATVNYHYDGLWLMAPGEYDERGGYYEGHRGEVMLQTGLGLYALAGGGHRTFRTMGRTRWETDAGLGWAKQLGAAWSLLAGFSGRRHQATNGAYDLWGTTGLLGLRWRFWRNWSVRVNGVVALDYYPDSAGSEAFHSPETRRDFLTKGRIGIWSPTMLRGIRFGLQYEPSRRSSTADLFSFSDHTVLLIANFGFSHDPWHPQTTNRPSFSRIGYGLDAKDDTLNDRLQDLLRADEDSQRGSSCLE